MRPLRWSLLFGGGVLFLAAAWLPMLRVAIAVDRSSIQVSSGTLPKLPDRGAPTGRDRGGASPQTTPSKLPKLKDRGAPTGRRRGGASRNNCPKVSTPLTALVPGVEKVAGNSQRSTSYLAFTQSTHPIFWVYIPATVPNQTRVGEFVLQNQAGDDLYRTLLTLPAASGSIGISLPKDDKYALQPDQPYHWYFQLYCGAPEAQAAYFYVDAWVSRETPSAAGQPEQLPNRFWYDALTQSAQSRNQLWSNLLTEVGLQDIANEPIIRRF